MQSENKIKNSIQNFYSDFGTKHIHSQISSFFFYELKVPALLLVKDETTIRTQNKPIQ